MTNLGTQAIATDTKFGVMQPRIPSLLLIVISTGVIFKGKLQFNKSTYGVTGDQPIFVYNNVLYGTWEKVKDVANAANADESLRAAYAQIGETPAADAEFGKAGFTVLRPNGSGDYEMYYCYWNRHNDNNDPNLMGPMEFAVVRNNVRSEQSG